MPTFEAPGCYVVFKRIDLLDEEERPEVVIFFDAPDLISGLFTLANFDVSEDNIKVPFGAGCSTIVLYPYFERHSPHTLNTFSVHLTFPQGPIFNTIFLQTC